MRYFAESGKTPLSAETIAGLSFEELAILELFVTRFSKLQDTMGAKLFPAVLELAGEHGKLDAFMDKLNRLEKIGAIQSAGDWMTLREARNKFAHDYPAQYEKQASSLNEAFRLAAALYGVLDGIAKFAGRYLPNTAPENCPMQ